MFSTSWGQSALTSGDILAPRAALIVWWKRENTKIKHGRGKLQGFGTKAIASAWKWMMTNYANEVLIVRCWKQVSRVDYAAQALSRTHLATALLMSLGAFQREQKKEGEVVRNYEETLPNSFILPASYNNPFPQHHNKHQQQHQQIEQHELMIMKKNDWTQFWWIKQNKG